MTYTYESFITYCDKYDVCNESFNLITKIQQVFAKLVLFIDGKIKKTKDGKIKQALQGLLKRAKSGLAKCKHLQKDDPELVKELQEEAQDIQQSVVNIEKDKYFYASQTFINAISSKDIGALRALLCGMLGSDPTWATTEFDEAIHYIISHGISKNELCETYKKQEDEYILSKDEWNIKYYGLLLVWLRDNFALDHRLKHIKEVGKIVYKDKLTYGKAKLNSHNKKGR